MSAWLQGGTLLVSVMTALWWWRVQHVGKRRFEIAEEALVSFALAKDALEYIRSPGSFSGEGEKRPRQDGETEGQRNRRDAYFVPIERINKTVEKFAGLRKTQILCKHHFGQDAYDAFGVLLDVRHIVSVSAAMLIEIAGELDFADKDLRREWEADIWGRKNEKDLLYTRLVEAESKLEMVCKPVLRHWANPLPMWLVKRLEPVTERVARSITTYL